MFSIKRHVVFFTESCIAARRFCHSLPTSTQSFFPLSQFCFMRMQTFLKTLLLTCAYAHASQEFLHFCCHKCHRLAINHYISIYCAKHILILTIKTYKGWKFGKKSHRQTQFLSEIGRIFCQAFVRFSSLVWHLWQQKINIAVGRRAHIRAWGRYPNFHHSFSCLSQGIIPNE